MKHTRILWLTVLLFSLFSVTSFGATKKLTTKWDKTFVKSTKVNHQKVTFQNRYGITLVGDLHTPKDMDKNKKYPALVVGPPFGGVKEQGAGIYAQTMAERGFVAMAFDPSFRGESGGEPRNMSTPDIYVEDFSAVVDYLGTRTYVDREKIGAIGICGSGGFAITAAQVDMRIKAVATASMYDISRVMRYGWMDSSTDESRNQMLTGLGEQRWKNFETGKTLGHDLFPKKVSAVIPEGLDPITKEFFEYYGMKRGFHPNAGMHANTSSIAFINFPLMAYIEKISPRPILFVIGENAHSRYFSEDAYKKAGEAKELYIVPNANHIDLYDDTTKIPFDKLESFFKTNLK